MSENIEMAMDVAASSTPSAEINDKKLDYLNTSRHVLEHLYTTKSVK